MKAILDIDEIKSFNFALGKICREMKEGKNNITKKFVELKDVWKDENYRQFEKTFTSTMSDVDFFLKYAEAYSKHLAKKARAAEYYLNRGR